jgi:hypothetical protein
MAINLIACTYYAPMLLTAEELVETNPLQEIQEKEMTKKIDFVIPAFKFLTQVFKIQGQVYFWGNSASFSIYEQEILLPPPDFSRFSL